MSCLYDKPFSGLFLRNRELMAYGFGGSEEAQSVSVYKIKEDVMKRVFTDYVYTINCP